MTIKQKQEYKRALYNFALAKLEERLATAQQAMLSAQEAANEEGKSSVGDKYETARAMGQIESEMNAKQLEEANKEIAHLLNINPAIICTHVMDGAVIKTDTNIFFLSVGLGQHVVNKKNTVFISASSPIGKIFANKIPGDVIEFNKTRYTLADVF